MEQKQNLMKNNAKLVSTLLLLFWAFMAGCSNCDDGSSSDSQERQNVVIDSTYTK
ncbi:hypothetical protein ABH942_001923 [Flavobacterium sp. 28YEA47A]